MSTAMIHADIERIVELQPTGWQDIRTFYRFYVDQPFCFPVKIEVDRHIAAIGCVIFNGNSCWLAHIIVSDRNRRQGLGMTITRQLIEIAEEHKVLSQFLIATEMGQPLYEQLEFVESCRYVFHKAPAEPPPLDTTGIRKLTPADLESLLALDRRATGIDLLRLRLSDTDQSPILPAGNTAAIEYLAHRELAVTSTAARMARHGEDPVDQSMIFNRVGGNFG